MLLRRIGSIAFWAFFVVSSAVMFVGALLVWFATHRFDRRLAALHLYTCAWAGLYTWCNPAWPVVVRGREHIAPGRPYVMVANHLSVVDIFVVHRLFRHFKWVSKASNFRIPFVGWNMRLNRYIPLERGNKQSVVAMLDACRVALRGGSSVMMFPEGTRSRDGQLQPFKTGAFELARTMAIPVLPVVIEGTHAALPSRGFTIRRQSIALTVLPALTAEDVDAPDTEAFSAAVRERFVAFLQSPRRH